MKRWLDLTLALLTAVLFLVSLLIGPAGLDPITGFRGLWAGGDTAVTVIMQEIRLPRALLAGLIGFSLGLAGAALQGFLRNPLAEPGIIGVSGMASLGAVIVFYGGIGSGSLLALPAGALAGALIAVLVLLAIASANSSSLTLILAGVALSSLAAALTALALNLSPNPFASYEVIFWLLGSVKDRSMAHVWIALPLMIGGWLMLLSIGRSLDALALGEDAARSMGIRINIARMFAVGGTALAVGASTAVAGAIGFVGLVVPHLLRPLTGSLPSALLLPSAFGGAGLLLAADIVARLVITDRELNLGVVTALVGAPFFLWLVIRSRREGAM